MFFMRNKYHLVIKVLIILRNTITLLVNNNKLNMFYMVVNFVH